MQKIIVTGSKGLIGSKFIARFGKRYQIIPGDLSGTPPVDITKEAQLTQVLEAHRDALGVIHLAAYTDVTGAFKQTDDKKGLAWQVNVIGTANVAKLCAQGGLYLIFLSTAYVFNGEKEGLYQEDDQPAPIEWYGRTKWEAEERVRASGGENLILRIDQPFDYEPFAKVDTLYRVINGLKSDQLRPQFTNHYFGPTYIDDLGKILDFALRKKLTGLYHASSGEKWSDYEFAMMVKDVLQLPGEIKKADLDIYLQTLNRPYQRNTAMSNQKLKALLDFELLWVREAVAQARVD